MSRPQPLILDQYYHIYNRGNNRENLFRTERNYLYFLKLYRKYIEPIAETYAYCLMPNHFHFMVRLRTIEEQQDWLSSFKELDPSHQFADLFSTYTKAFNKAYSRTGSLFVKPFKRILVDKYGYYTWLIVYIHRNPQKHGFVADFREWKYSSYKAILSQSPTHVQRQIVLDWFDGREAFIDIHNLDVDEQRIRGLIAD